MTLARRLPVMAALVASWATRSLATRWLATSGLLAFALAAQPALAADSSLGPLTAARVGATVAVQAGQPTTQPATQLLAPPNAQPNAQPPALLPSGPALIAAFEATPAWQAARAGMQAEQAGARQSASAAREWTANLSALRRRQSLPGEKWNEWELGLERPWRSPSKQAAVEAAGNARVAQARAAQTLALRAYAQDYLARWIDWRREAAAAQVHAEVAATLAEQLRVVELRLRRGDAAAIDQRQARAAWLQAQAQADAAAARQRIALQALRTRFPELTAEAGEGIDPRTLPAATADPGASEALLELQLQRDPALTASRLETQTLRALARVDEAERRPDPTVGIKGGSSRGGNEKLLGLTLSLPLGGEARRAGADAAAARAQAAEARLADLQRQARAEALQRQEQAALAQTQWQRLQQVAAEQQAAADTLARGFSLGEGSLSEVLTARRLAQEQRLQAAQAEVDGWAARLQLDLATGRLWAELP